MSPLDDDDLIVNGNATTRVQIKNGKCDKEATTQWSPSLLLIVSSNEDHGETMTDTFGITKSTSRTGVCARISELGGCDNG